MKKSYSGMLVAALAVVGMLGTGSKANAATIIDFDNAIFDGGTFTSLGGGHYSGANIEFDSIYLKDNGTAIAGVQCGAATSLGAASHADTCKLNFNTSLNQFSVTTPTGLWAIGADLAPYTADRGALVLAGGSNVLTGNFSVFQDFGTQLFVAAGIDTKNAALLQFFGLSPTTGFVFANTEIHASPSGEVTEADLINAQVPEPATMMLLGTGLLAAFRARRKSA